MKPTNKTAQPKMGNAALNRKPPVAPSVYHPQPVPKVLQTKSSPVQNPLAAQAKVMKPISHGLKSATVQPQTSPPSRPVPSRSHAVQRSLDDLPAEMVQEIASYLNPQERNNLRLTNSTLARQAETEWHVLGRLINNCHVDEYNYKAICKYVAENGGSSRWQKAIPDALGRLAQKPGSDLTKKFWTIMRRQVGKAEIHKFLQDPKFVGLFGRASFLRRWGKTLLVGGTAATAFLAYGINLYMNSDEK